jgi:hypothetical protein
MEPNVKKMFHHVMYAEQKHMVTISIKVIKLKRKKNMFQFITLFTVTCESCKAFFRRNALKSMVNIE